MLPLPKSLDGAHDDNIKDYFARPLKINKGIYMKWLDAWLVDAVRLNPLRTNVETQ